MNTAVDEAWRLQSLVALNVLDTDANVELDRITGLVSTIFQTPIALVSLIDGDRQWFQSRHGLDVSETPRDIAFCDYAIRTPDIFEVPDASKDPQFMDNPLVIGDPFIRYYCGAPLALRNGARIGTLCLIDTKPREPMTRGKRLLLRELALQVVREIELQALAIDTSQIQDLLPKQGTR